MRMIRPVLEVPDSLRSPEYDLVALVREVEDQNRIAVVPLERIEELFEPVVECGE